MLIRKMQKWTMVGVVGASLLAASCSSESNINSYMISDKQENALDVLISEAKIAYNAGDYERAREKGEAAFALAENNERVSVLLGYIYLSSAGIDLIQLAKSMLNTASGSTSTGTGSGSSTGTGTSSGTSTGSSSSSSNAATQLGSLSSVVNVSKEELATLGELDEETSGSAFADIPVIHPFDAPDAREKGVATLEYITKAINITCPFVKSSLKIADDPRHKEDKCPSSGVDAEEPGKLNFLWAFSHLADALTFYSVLMYSTDSSGKANIERRAAKVSDKSVDFTQYLSMIASIAEDIEKIFATGNPNSQINAVLNGLTVAATSFAAIGGGEEFTGGITKALETVKSSSAATSQVQSLVLTSQLTTGLSKTLNTKAAELKTSDPTKFAQNKTSICSAFESISAGQGNDIPTECKTSSY